MRPDYPQLRGYSEILPLFQSNFLARFPIVPWLIVWLSQYNGASSNTLWFNERKDYTDIFEANLCNTL